MKLTALLLATIPALLLAQTDAERLDALNRQADRHLAAYDLDKAESLLDEALTVARRIGTGHELPAIVRLTDLQFDLQKRDGQGWMNIALPHLIRGIELAKAAPVEMGNQLAARLALTIIQMPPGQTKPDMSAPFVKFLELWIGQLEQSEGPLSTHTAIPYRALLYSSMGSEGLSRAQNACDIWGAANQTPPPDFAALLVDCAEIDLHGMNAESSIRLSRKARAAASARGPRYAYEKVLSYLIEGESEFWQSNNLGAVSAFDSAVEVAGKLLAPSHPIWDRIHSDRAPLLRSPGASSQHELVPRSAPSGAVPGRIQPAKVITKVDPLYTKKARAEKFEGSSLVAVLIAADGKGKVFNTFQPVPYELNASVQKAITEWTFQPWTRDGKAVAGVSLFEVKFQLKN